MVEQETNKNFTDQDFKCMDSHDMYRIKIYNKEKKVGKSFIFNLTEQEANFIKSEIDYFVFNSHGEPEKDRYYYSERQISKRIINKIDKLFDISEQRDIKLKEILGF